MTDARLLEAWLRLSADAVRGADQAQEALRALGQQTPDPAALSEWMTTWFPAPPTTVRPGSGGTAPSPQPQELLSLAEEWWRGLGVVPLYKYLEVLRRCDDLTRRLEEAEDTIARLRELADADRDVSTGNAVKEALDGWEELTRRTLEAQAEWARAWGVGAGEEQSNGT